MDGNSALIDNKNLQILILNRSHIVGVGMERLIQKRFKDAEIFLAESCFALFRTLLRERINVLIFDTLESFEKTSGFASRIKSIRPDLKLLVLSGRKLTGEFTHMTYKNIDGFLSYNSNEDDFFNALSFLREDKCYVKVSMARRFESSASPAHFSYKVNDLSSRELEVARLYIIGDGNLEISQRLNLSPSTVSTYKKRIFDKLGIDNIMSLARLFETRF